MLESKALDLLLAEASAPIRWRVEREILGREPRTYRKRVLEVTFRLLRVKKIAG